MCPSIQSTWKDDINIHTTNGKLREWHVDMWRQHDDVAALRVSTCHLNLDDLAPSWTHKKVPCIIRTDHMANRTVHMAPLKGWHMAYRTMTWETGGSYVSNTVNMVVKHVA
jgi:hypothetical protein